MLAFFIQRLFQAALVMIAVGFIAFSLFNFVGDPVSLMLPPEATSADRDEVRKSLGLDQPFYLQFVKFAGNALQGNFGISLRLGRPVSQLLIERLPATLELATIAASLALLVGIPTGVYTALKRDSWLSRFILTISLVGVSLPSFLIGIFLILIFAVWLGWLPTGGWTSPRHWVLPVLTNSLGPVLVLLRYTRAGTGDAMRANYVRTARAKGLSQRRIVLVHVLKNALTPLLTVGGPLAAGLITGSFFVESMFRIPGIGFYFVTAIQHRDYPLIMATTLVWTTLISVAYLLTDVLYALVDPRVKL